MKILYVTNGDDKYGAASSLKELIQLEMGMDNIEIEVLNTEICVFIWYGCGLFLCIYVHNR